MVTFLGLIFEQKAERGFKQTLKSLFREVLHNYKSASTIIESEDECWQCTSIVSDNNASKNPMLLTNHRGILFGDLFLKQSPANDAKLNLINDLDKIWESNGKFLSDNYWGNYTFIISNNNSSIKIFKDPSGLSSFFL